MLNRLTPVVKNLLIINVVVFIGQMLFKSFHLSEYLSLWDITSSYFKPYQYFTYMFAHSTTSFFHIIFNMMGLVFLGPLLERFWGFQKFLIFYMVTGLGAGVLFSGISYYQNTIIEEKVSVYMSDPSPEGFNILANNDFQRVLINNPEYSEQIYLFIDAYDSNPNDPGLINQGKYYIARFLEATNNGAMNGASGAIYGILMAFGLLFPNTELMLLFPPIPIKAKYLVMVLGAYAIYAGFKGSSGDTTAHFAHLGGMIFAFIMIQYWKSKRTDFY